LKLLSELHDKCQDTVIQYTEFMQSQCSSDEGFRSSIPSVKELMLDFNLRAEMAFHIKRPYTFPNGYYNIVDSGDAEAKEKFDRAKKEKGADTSKTFEPSFDLTTPPSGPLGEILVAANPNIKEISAAAYGEDLFEIMDEQLYCTFWNLSLYDIYVPIEAYEQECKRQRDSAARLENEIKESRLLSPSEVKKKEKEKKVFVENAGRLQEELSRHKKHVSDIKKRLAADKDKWIHKYSEEFSYAFLQACVFPRCTFTASDSIYCLKFFEMMHNNSVTNFSTLHFLSTIFDSLHGVLFKCTETEAGRFGRFLLELFTLLEKWRVDSAGYKDKVASKRGFAINFEDSSSKKATHKEYLAVLFKWHQKLARSVVASLDSSEYLEKRNALMVLIKLVKVFPRIKAIYQVIEKKVVAIKDEEKREDLKLLGKRYETMLQQEKANQVPNEAFKGEPAKSRSQHAEKAVKEARKEADEPEKRGKEKKVKLDDSAPEASVAEQQEHQLKEMAKKSMKVSKSDVVSEDGGSSKRRSSLSGEEPRSKVKEEEKDKESKPKKEDKKRPKDDEKRKEDKKEDKKKEPKEERKDDRGKERLKEEKRPKEEEKRKADEERPNKRTRMEPGARDAGASENNPREGPREGSRDGGRDGGRDSREAKEARHAEAPKGDMRREMASNKERRGSEGGERMGRDEGKGQGRDARRSDGLETKRRRMEKGR